jgi:hypothetical protein
MTSIRQIEANRRNAIRSTGPRTDDGKDRSRRNAIRHGLSAETVIEIVEDLEDYRGFEAAVIADYDPLTAVERELVLRLASLLWRLRRASAIETDLFRIQAEILRDRRARDTLRPRIPNSPDLDPQRWPGQASHIQADWICKSVMPDKSEPNGRSAIVSPIRDLTHSFQRQNNLDHGAFERLGRYEAALWRQMMKTLFILRHRVRR